MSAQVIVLIFVAVVALVAGFALGLCILGKSEDEATEKALRERDASCCTAKQCGANFHSDKCTKEKP